MAEQAAAEPFLIMFLCNHCCEYVFPAPLSRQGSPPRRCSPLEMAYMAPSGTSYIGSATCRPHQVPRFCVTGDRKSTSTLLSSQLDCSEGPWWVLLDKVKRRI
ncbi:hypothetical protein D4764_04G0003320 [Takifugu flavidus]|uniref:Uncharacterized protein n=1 Tax=Takifugu flavidus TaxID=433684 RepID=A0A5C6N3I1_9TELE|nr:hypothetical protein D4764_04G0003320 [Takifugu flavidus]